MAAPLIVALVGVPPLLLLAAGLVPESFANRLARGFGSACAGLCAAAVACGLAATVLLFWGGPVDLAVWQLAGTPLNVGVWFDALAATMVLLIGSVGLIIARYAARYLDGELTQGRFFKWLAFTIGAVLVLVLSRNLVMLSAAWMLTSLGLHKLLVQYPDRPWAIWAARKKFLVSRIGDAFLLAGLGLTLACFGSADYADVFAAAERCRSEGGLGWCGTAIGLFFVLGAMTKSAQVPFHSWLPDTMEAPTPVSALMHAGIINAGGFLVIRLSPLVALSHLSLDVLAITGGVTALFGGIVMLAQTSIKRALAFSTVAQMGFMMLQCGLGAFSAALLHIVAHSLYKAHAFLACGSVLDAAARTKAGSGKVSAGEGPWALSTLPIAMAASSVVVAVVLGIGGVDVAAKPGGAVLWSVMVIAVSTLLWQGARTGSWKIAAASVVGGAAVAACSLAGTLIFDKLLSASSVARVPVDPSTVDSLVAGLVVAGFLGVFTIGSASIILSRLAWVRTLYVHASNGFYLDIPARQLTARVWGLSSPVP